MNNKRRKYLTKMAEELTDIASRLQDIKTDVENILEEEQSCFDNLPESLQGGEKGETMQAAIDSIANADNHIEEAISSIESISESLIEAAQ